MRGGLIIAMQVPNAYAAPNRQCSPGTSQLCAFKYYPPPSIQLATPNAGPLIGQTLITLWGSNMTNTHTGEAQCKWLSEPNSWISINGQMHQGTWTSIQPAQYHQLAAMPYLVPGAASAVWMNKSFTCTAAASAISDGSVQLDIALNGQDYTGRPVLYSYYDQTTISLLKPSCGPVEGGTIVQASFSP